MNADAAHRGRITVVSALATAVCAAGCSAPGASPRPPPAPSVGSARTEGPQSAATTAAPRPTGGTSPAPGATSTSPPGPAPSSPRPAPRFDASAAHADVVRLAGFGPRLSTGPAFLRAAGMVTDRFTRAGYRVRTQTFAVPAGNNWGTRVAAGTSRNVIAEPPGFQPARNHVIIGAHLDSIAVSPGAEDNASGVAVMLELARMARQANLTQVRFVAFGAEEPRGSTDADHHYGSRYFVRGLGNQASQMRAMVSLDRVGVPTDRLPVCSSGPNGVRLRAELIMVAQQAGVPARACTNDGSDHWQFEQAGLPAIRLGSVPYAGYHSPRDTPDVVDAAQLGRTGRATWAWLSQAA